MNEQEMVYIIDLAMKQIIGEREEMTEDEAAQVILLVAELMSEQNQEVTS